MKINHYAVVPAQVRYDRTLTSTTFRLYAEIAAATNAYGICEEDNRYFSSALGVDERTIMRCVNQLVDAQHISKIAEAGIRKLKLTTKDMPLPTDVEITYVSLKPVEDITPYVEDLLKIWEVKLGVTIRKKDLYIDPIRKLLRTFTKDEITEAVRNRLDYVLNSEWHQQNPVSAAELEHVIGNEKNLLRWLNAKPTIKESINLKPFKK